MASSKVSFDELVQKVKALPREQQVRLFEAVGLGTGSPSPQERPAPETGPEYHCGRCGAMLPPDEVPAECPGCGAPRSGFVLEAED